MSPLPVRRLHIDFSLPFARRWNGNDAFRSAFMNALSMSFPHGEQFFIDSVKAGVQHLAPELREYFAEEVKGFIGQEATHRHLHALFNHQLEAQGFDNLIERRAMRRTKKNAHLDVRLHVAATAGLEHITALFANWLLRSPSALRDTEPRLKIFWLWHSAEETEHRSVAFDLYRALGGNEKYRLLIFKYVTFMLLLDLTLQTVLNLWHDRSLLRWSTWASGARLLFARDGLLRSNYRGWLAYQSSEFHPDQHDAKLSEQWLTANGDQFTVLGKA